MFAEGYESVILSVGQFQTFGGMVLACKHMLSGISPLAFLKKVGHGLRRFRGQRRDRSVPHRYHLLFNLVGNDFYVRQQREHCEQKRKEQTP